MVGDAIVEFVERISLKTRAHFGSASKSQELFLTVPSWKRAMVFMHLLRYVLGLQNMKPWDKFDLKDYKTNVRAVSRYTKLDKEIIQRSVMFKKLPEKVGEGTDPEELTRIRRRSNNVFTSENETESPLKKRFKVDQSSSSDEEFESQRQTD